MSWRKSPNFLKKLISLQILHFRICFCFLGTLPIYVCAKNGHLECLQYIYHHKGDLNAVNHEGCSLAWAAAKNDHLSVLQYLSRRKVDLNKPNHLG